MPSRLEKEAEHFDQMVSGKSDETVFYDSSFVRLAMEKLQGVAYKSMGSFKGKRVLFYGCGDNFIPIRKMLNQGCERIFAIDISPMSIEAILKNCIKTGVEERVISEVMDCMALEFDDDSFDIIYGRAILHHLDVDVALKEIKRVLKPNGKAVFIEPLGMNPIINLYRRLTPNLRTADERPFTWKDIRLINQAGFSLVTFYWSNLFVNVGILLSTLTGIVKLDHRAYAFFERIDRVTLKYFPFLKSFCWNTIVTLDK